MGRCPFCMSSTMPGDSICFSCGRVITGSVGMDDRVKGNFQRASSRGAVKGQAPQMMMPARSRRRNKGKKKNVVLVIAVACVFMFTPAQEQVMALWKKVEEELIAAFFGTNEYPVEVEYTLEQDILISHSGTSSEYTFKYRFSIPPDRTSNHGTQYHFVYDDESGKTNLEPTSLQRVVGMNVIFGNGDTYSIPLNGDSVDKSNAIPLSQNYGELYYPTAGGSDYQCIYGQCVIWESSLNPGSSKGVTIEYEIEGAAFAWQKSSKIPSKIPGKSNGISASNSGTFSDIWTEASPEEQNQIRGAGTLYLSYGRNSQWYKADDQSGNERWVIDAENSIVIDAAQDILGDLSSDDKQNVYAFTKATFDYLRDRVTYDPYAPVKARSGPECLSL